MAALDLLTEQPRSACVASRLTSAICGLVVAFTGCKSTAKQEAVETSANMAHSQPAEVSSGQKNRDVYTQTQKNEPSPVPSNGAAGKAATVEVPAGTVSIQGKSTVVGAFLIDRTEVTTEAYARCVAETKCSPAADDDIDCNWQQRKSKPGYPINCVTVQQAQQYCASTGKRLPTAAEWQLAAGGAEKRQYPWGAAHPSNIGFTERVGGKLLPGEARHNLCWVGDRSERETYPKSTCPVGSFPAGNTPSGIADLAGNVAEWTSSTEKLPHGPVHHIIKGGGYNFDRLGRLEVAVDDYTSHGGMHQAADVGFRCVTDGRPEQP